MTSVLTVAHGRTAVAWYAEGVGVADHVRIGERHRSQLGVPDGPAAEVVVSEVGRDDEHPIGDVLTK